MKRRKIIIKDLPKSGYKVTLDGKNAFGKVKFITKKEAIKEKDFLKSRGIKGKIIVKKVKINIGDFK